MTAAVKTAATLLGRDTSTSVQVAPLAARTALVRREFSQYTPYGSWEAMTAAYAASPTAPGSTFDMRTSLRNLLDWRTPEGAPSKVTKATVKLVTGLLQEQQHYAATVEMLGFAAAWAPLLDANRLCNLIRVAADVTTAYAPERYIIRFARDLSTLFTDGVSTPPERMELLAKDLFRVVHDGRYWDVTGSGKGRATPARLRDDAAEAAAVAFYVQRLLNGADPGTPQARQAVLAALAGETLPFNTATAALVAELPDSVEARDALTAIAERSRRGEWVNPDTGVLVSSLSWLRPEGRPESPASWLTAAAVAAWTPADGGSLVRDGWPDKPKSWAELYGRPLSKEAFPLPAAVYRQHGRTLPGTDIELALVQNAVELQANVDHMRNCTWMYQENMERGTYALFRFAAGDRDYNAAMVLHPRTGRWQVREVNSRFNEGLVPAVLQEAFAALVAELPPVNRDVRR